MRIKLLALMVSAVAFIATSAHAGHHATSSAVVPEITQTAVMTGLENPWDVALLDDGTMFYTEKCKGVSVRMPNGDVHALYGMKDTSGYASMGADLHCTNQAGMLGLAVDPDFAKNRRIYVASASTKYHGDGCKTNFERCDGNIVMRLDVSKNMSRAYQTEPISLKIFSSSHSSQITHSVVTAHTMVTDLLSVLRAGCGLLLVTDTVVFAHSHQHSFAEKYCVSILTAMHTQETILLQVSTSVFTHTVTEMFRVLLSEPMAQRLQLSMALGTMTS